MTADHLSPAHPGSLLKGLYLILDERWSLRCLLPQVLDEAGQAGVKLIQYRNKTGSMRDAYAMASILRLHCNKLGMMFVVNDRCDLAMAVEADGVHLGQDDLPIVLARKLVGRSMVIGVSTHNAEQVTQATHDGADYLGFGPIFPTETKSNHDPVVGIAGLKHIRGLTSLPVFAIGGIAADVVQDLCDAGANGVAVASGILDSQNRQKAFTQFLSSFH